MPAWPGSGRRTSWACTRWPVAARRLRYVRLPDDERLRVILAPPVAGSRLVVVRGEPGTGTTRAAWEAVAELLAEWPLEYPRTAAALAARLEAGIPAGTVLWLGELGRYADADGGAAALDRLDDLFDEDGYLVVATIWPWQWDAYIAAVGAGRGAGDPAWLAGRMLARLDELSLYDPSSISPDYGVGSWTYRPGSLPLSWPRRPGAATRCWPPRRPQPAGGAGRPVPGRGSRTAEPLRRPRRRPARPGDPHRGHGRHPARPRRAAAGQPAGAGRGRLPARNATRRRPGKRAGRSVRRRAGGCHGNRAGLGLRRRGRRGRRARGGPRRGRYRIPAGRDADQHGRQVRQDQAGAAAPWHALMAHAADAGTGLLDTTRLGQAARDRGFTGTPPRCGPRR